VFGNESQKTKKLFDYLQRVWNPWERTGPCMYRGCTDISIRRSHTIHRAGSLERIAEGQHVLTPRPREGWRCKVGTRRREQRFHISGILCEARAVVF
jgi:hypothetical protein